jgi:hypothetical protein
VIKAETSYGSHVFKVGLELYKRQSLPLFALAFGSVAFNLLTFVLPKVLGLVVCFLTPVVVIGVLRCLKFLDDSPGPVTLQQTFEHFYDDSRRQDYLPFCLLSLVGPLLYFFVSSPFGLASLVILLIQLIIEIMFFYGLPLTEFHRMPAQKALLQSLDATALNWKPLTVYSLLLLAYLFLSCLTLGIGLLFLVPIATASRYYFWKKSFSVLNRGY